MRVYLDNCCLNRPFDDQTAFTIRLETESKLQIQKDIQDGKFALAWLYVLDFENAVRKSAGSRWSFKNAKTVPPPRKPAEYQDPDFEFFVKRIVV